MKHTYFYTVAFLVFFSASLFSQAASTRCPAMLAGLWKGSDRYIYFEGGENSSLEDDSEKALTMVLKEYYGWYLDRAAESVETSATYDRKSNAAQSKQAQNILVSYTNLLDREYESCGAWELSIKYPGQKDVVRIPVAVVSGNLYLDFALRDDSASENPDSASVNGFYKHMGIVDGITLSIPVQKKELDCLYVVENLVNQDENVLEEKKEKNYNQTNYLPSSNRMLSFSGSSAKDLYESKYPDVADENGAMQNIFAYHVRYWHTDMEYDDSSVTYFMPGDQKKYSMHKHILVAGEVFTNATGRRKEVRNMNKAVAQKISNYMAVFNENRNVLFLTFGKPYLIRDEGNLTEIVNENNKRKKSPPEPLFLLSE